MNDTMVAATTIAEKRTAHAAQIGVEETRVRAFKLDLAWMLEHGTLVDVDIHGATMFSSRASLEELGIPASDTRAARLRPGTRELVDDHQGCHYFEIDGATVYMGFDPKMPPPPAFYFGKSEQVILAELISDESNIILDMLHGRWTMLPAQAVDGWEPTTRNGKTARWLKLALKSADGIDEDSLVCNPIKAFRSLEVRFRQSLDKYGNALEGFGGYRWIGFKAYWTWREEWDRLQVEWAAVKAYTIWRYAEFVDALESDFEAIAAEAWQAMAARHLNGMVCMIGKKAVETQAGFVAAIVERAIARMPSRERIKNDLHADYVPALLLGQETVAADQLAAERLKTEVAAEQAAQSVEWAKATAEKEVIWEGERAQERVIREAEQVETARLRSERMKLEAMREAELEKARQIMASTTSPYQELFDRLRTEMFAGAQAVLDSLKKNEGLRGKVGDKARNMVEMFRLMNSHGDQDLEALMEQLAARLPANGGTSKGQAANTAIEEALGEIVELTRRAAFETSHRTGSEYGFEALEL